MRLLRQRSPPAEVRRDQSDCFQNPLPRRTLSVRCRAQWGQWYEVRAPSRSSGSPGKKLG